MATSFTFYKEDQSNMRELVDNAFCRRKQLVDWSLSEEDLIDVQFNPEAARHVRFLLYNYPRILNWNSAARFHVEDTKAPKGVLSIWMNASKNLVIKNGGVNYTEDILCYNGPATARLRDWAWKATQVELENRWAKRIINRVINSTTTHQQIHRYMPELYALIANQQSAIPLKTYEKHRFVDVYEELKITGSARAQKLELSNVTPKDRLNLRTLIAQCLLLKAHDGLGDGTLMDKTWINC